MEYLGEYNIDPDGSNPMEEATLFQENQFIAFDDNPPSLVASGDIDGDGYPELIVASDHSSSDASTLRLFENQASPDEYFQRVFVDSGVLWDLDAHVEAMEFADFDLDGDLDLVVGLEDSPGLYYENVDGELVMRDNVGPGYDINSMEVGDINQNGFADVTFIQDDGEIWLSDFDPDKGEFIQLPHLIEPGVTIEEGKIWIDDIDGNGIEDIVLRSGLVNNPNYYDDNVVVYGREDSSGMIQWDNAQSFESEFPSREFIGDVGNLDTDPEPEFIKGRLDHADAGEWSLSYYDVTPDNDVTGDPTTWSTVTLSEQGLLDAGEDPKVAFYHYNIVDADGEGPNDIVGSWYSGTSGVGDPPPQYATVFSRPQEGILNNQILEGGPGNRPVLASDIDNYGIDELIATDKYGIKTYDNDNDISIRKSFQPIMPKAQ
ncbi:hypothetical protein GF362_04575 [Candidatus Dojkabacteria bacterium]|nr:hypothetical protein [Candidatus Dojkabacteria bacterium]